VIYGNTGALSLTGVTFTGGATATAPSGVTLAGAITSWSPLTLGPTILSANTILATNNNSVTFGSTINSASSTSENLTVNAGSGDITVTGVVGGSHALGAVALNSTGVTTLTSAVTAGSLTTDAGGTTAINGGSVTTTGAQTYNDALTLGAATTLATSNSAVVFGSTVDSASSTEENLTVNAGSGDITVTGVVGGSHFLGAVALNTTGQATLFSAVNAARLTSAPSGQTVFDVPDSTTSPAVTTITGQTYGAVVLEQDTFLLDASNTFTAAFVTANGHQLYFLSSDTSVDVTDFGTDEALKRLLGAILPTYEPTEVRRQKPTQPGHRLELPPWIISLPMNSLEVPF